MQGGQAGPHVLLLDTIPNRPGATSGRAKDTFPAAMTDVQGLANTTHGLLPRAGSFDNGSFPGTWPGLSVRVLPMHVFG